MYKAILKMADQSHHINLKLQCMVLTDTSSGSPKLDLNMQEFKEIGHSSR